MSFDTFALGASALIVFIMSVKQVCETIEYAIDKYTDYLIYKVAEEAKRIQ